MKCVLIAVALCLTTCANLAATDQPPPQAGPVTTVILVRHGERSPGDGDVPLSDRGRERAAALARLLVDANIRSIITSDMIRTQQTAAPVAKQAKIEPEIIPADKLDAVVERIRAMKGGTVLVVHHSNTVPQLVEKLGAKTPPIRDDEFDRLIVLTLPANGASVVMLRYGS
jgi:broad specificity phosphatase PhoE